MITFCGMKKNLSIIASLFTAALLTTACSDDESQSPSSYASCTVFESGDSAYTIECPDGTSVTIHDGTNGKDGQDGSDGKDGQNGTDGKDGQDGTDGQNGTDGKDGQDGTDGSNGVSADTLVNKTSCTIKDNENSTYTIECPDGTSATVGSGATASSGTGVTTNSTTLTFSTFTLNYNTEKLLYVYDYQKYMNGMEDSVEVTIRSSSDTTGITVVGYPSPTIPSYFEVRFYVTPNKSHDNSIHASNGDVISFFYKSGYNLGTDKVKQNWNLPNISKSGLLKFSKKIYSGDSAKIYVTLTDADLTEETIQLPLTINSVSYNAILEGGEGHYAGTLLLTRSTNAKGKNTFIVKDTANLVISYNDASSSATISDEARWFYYTKGTIQFDYDYRQISGKSNIYIYLIDEDNTKSSETVWVRNESTKDSIKVTLSKYSSYDYYYGYFCVSNDNSSDVLYIPDSTYITVSYYDESAKERIAEQSLIIPNKSTSESVTFKFKNNSYFGIADKATLNFYSGNLNSQTSITYTVTSTSDPVGYTQSAIYYSSSLLDNGLVGFTLGKSGNGYIQVANGDSVYATYISYSGKKYKTSIIWYADLKLDVEDYSCNTESTTLMAGKYNTTTMYVCQGGKFRKASTQEVAVNTTCVTSNIGKEYSSTISDYICTAEGFQSVYGTLSDSRDNKTYKTVRIGTQTWMAENLNYNETDNTSIANYSWCYDNEEINCSTYGRLYTWTAAMNISSTYSSKTYNPYSKVKGICPAGSHLPTTSEWNTLTNTANTSELRTGDWYYSTNYPANNSTGFNMKASGEKNSNFSELTEYASFWSANEYDSSRAYEYYFRNNNSHNSNYTSKTYARSVRCVLD